MSNDQKRYALINRNLLNYPLARDSRVRVMWRRLKKSGRWTANLPGDNRIAFRLPADTPVRRIPTGFDVHVLMHLLRQAQVDGQAEQEWVSRASLLKAMGLSSDQANRLRLAAALSLWSTISVRFRCWYEVGEKEPAIVELPPPIESLDAEGRVIRVTVADEWREMTRFRQRVPLPLPNNAAAQNLILMLLTSVTKWDEDTQLTVTLKRRVRSVTRKIGLDHAHRSERLDHVLAIAFDWFAAHGGELHPVTRNGWIIFAIKLPGGTRQSIVAPEVRRKPKPRRKLTKEKVKRVRPRPSVRLHEKPPPRRYGASDEMGRRIWVDERGRVLPF